MEPFEREPLALLGLTRWLAVLDDDAFEPAEGIVEHLPDASFVPILRVEPVEVDGLGPIDEVSERVFAALDAHRERRASELLEPN